MSDTADDAWFPVGKVVGFHGLNGEIKVRARTNTPEILLDIEHVEIRPAKGQTVAATVSSLRVHRQTIILTLGGYEDRTAVEPLLNAEIFAPKEELRALDANEFWVSDLVGLTVFTTSGAHVGEVLSVISAGNEILEISSSVPGKTILVPFIKELVPVVDLEARRIEVKDLPGLIEPQ